jgi:hypothetical protein
MPWAMRRLLIALLLVVVSCLVHAENGCPPGMMPYSGTDISSCGPVPPGYYKNNQQAQAPQVRWASTWGAIATDSINGATGVSTGAVSKSVAEDAALDDCRSKMQNASCTIQIAYDNECAAMVAGDHGYNVTADATQDKAIDEGMKTCLNAKDSNCHVYYSGCSLPRQIQ